MIAENKLYQDDRNNCVFVGYDNGGVAIYWIRIGTNPKYKFKGEVKGSNKAFAPSSYYNKNYETVQIFESVIDAMSYETLKSNVPVNMIALSGVSFSKISQYLNDNPQTKYIIMMLDNDDAGIEASQKIGKHLDHLGYSEMIKTPRIYKDWNEELVAKASEKEKPSLLESIRENRDTINRTKSKVAISNMVGVER